ncbi:MAG TPA: hypothetical protein VHQ03_09110, partial [Candidatus Dormibacteraeota bacterium]|nr:hypothetical protein [Candidatus Dormibacteraeota bacterium]
MAVEGRDPASEKRAEIHPANGELVVLAPALGKSKGEPASETLAKARREVGIDGYPAGTREALIERLSTEISAERRAVLRRGDVAKIVNSAINAEFARQGKALNRAERRDLVTDLMQELYVAPDAPPVAITRRQLD